MAQTVVLPLLGNPDVKALLELLNTPEFQTQRQEYTALLNHVDSITQQYSTILTELNALKEQVGKLGNRKGTLSVMGERLDTFASDVGEKMKNLKDGVILFTKNALDTVKEKGLSALGSVFGVLHVKDGLQAMSNGLAKSVQALDKAVHRVESLDRHNREKAAIHENSKTAPSEIVPSEAVSSDAEPSDVALPVEAQSASLSELLGDTRMDFENLSQDELKEVYKNLLAIGMNNELTANENICLSSLVDEIGDMLPECGGQDPQGVEIQEEHGLEA